MWTVGLRSVSAVTFLQLLLGVGKQPLPSSHPEQFLDVGLWVLDLVARFWTLDYGIAIMALRSTFKWVWENPCPNLTWIESSHLNWTLLGVRFGNLSVGFWQFEQMHFTKKTEIKFAIWTNTPYWTSQHASSVAGSAPIGKSSDSSILQFGQIYFAIWTNTFYNSSVAIL